MQSLVKDNFSALGLAKYGVEIQFDRESQQEIIEYIDQENFNSLSYLKQDYFNFKKYVNSEYPPKHMDFLNNDCAPDLMRFLQIKIGGRKTGCYYSFLQGIEEENLPVFSEDQIAFIRYTSSLLPLVRPHEFIAIRKLLSGPVSANELRSNFFAEITNCAEDEVDHTIKFMIKKGAIKEASGLMTLNTTVDEQFLEYMEDLLSYGLTQYESSYKNAEKFILWHNYRMDQVQLKLLKDPDHNQKGTYFYGDEVIVFASLKKDASVEERLAYKNKFLTANTFQWECENNISDSDLQALRLCKYVHLFIRKVDEEHGVRLPFIYVGEGRFSNERRQDKMDSVTGNKNTTYLYDIPMKDELPEYLQYDFGVAM